jgi:pimeloyl-ACP methyl ester carboxylesterase
MTENSNLSEDQLSSQAELANLEDHVEHGFADSRGVKIHYASLGQGPLIVMIHGFPDFWYTWRHQMVALAPHYRVVAMDQRGYNLSDKPEGVKNYAMSYLLGDVRAVIEQQGQQQAIVIGHDWGGMVAWQFARHLPTYTEKLIILNLPHPRGLSRELAHNPQQQKNSQYARNFQQEGAHLRLSAERLAEWVTDPLAREKYIQAFQRSDFAAMLNYYKANYPSEPYVEDTSPVSKIKSPVLQIHGLQDQALLADGLNGTWEWIEQDYTLTTIPGAGHFVQQDAADLVTRTIKSWLAR